MRRPSAERVFPEARDDGVVVEELGDEILIYDLNTDEAHCLNPTAAVVWKHCDGNRSVASLAGLFSDDGEVAGAEELVWDAVEQLNGLGLFSEPVLRPPQSRDWSRREVLVRIGGVGAAAAAVPVVTSIVAPIPEAAASHACSPACSGVNVCCGHDTPSTNQCKRPDGALCGNGGECCSGRCPNATPRICLPPL